MREASSEGALADDRGVGHFIFQQQGAWSITSGKLSTLSEQQFVDRHMVDTACNGMEVYSEITVRNLQGSCGLPRRQRPKSVFQFESYRVFDQQNSELVSQDAGYKHSNV